MPKYLGHPVYRVMINDWPKLWPYIWNNLCSRHHFSVTKGYLDMIHLCFNPRKVNFLDYGWARGALCKGQKSGIILQYSKLLQCRTPLFLPSSDHWDPGHHTACKGGAFASLGEWAQHFFINFYFMSNMVDGQTVVVFNHLTNHHKVFLVHCFSFATRSFCFLCLWTFEWASRMSWSWDPAVWKIWIMIPEPSPHGSCAA